VPAHVIRVVDGDTVYLLLDLGWRITYEARCRIAGINAPELNTPEGLDARGYAEMLLPPGSLVKFVSHSLDKYGRPLGDIFDADGKSFAAEMKAAGYAQAVKD
jgi:micrococcal nuclease